MSEPVKPTTAANTSKRTHVLVSAGNIAEVNTKHCGHDVQYDAEHISSAKLVSGKKPILFNMFIFVDSWVMKRTANYLESGHAVERAYG